MLQLLLGGGSKRDGRDQIINLVTSRPGEGVGESLSAEKIQVLITSNSVYDARLLVGPLRFGGDTHQALQHLGGGGRPKAQLPSLQQLPGERGAKASMKVTTLRHICYHFEADGLLMLYKAQVRPIVEYRPFA